MWQEHDFYNDYGDDSNGINVWKQNNQDYYVHANFRLWLIAQSNQMTNLPGILFSLLLLLLFKKHSIPIIIIIIITIILISI